MKIEKRRDGKRREGNLKRRYRQKRKMKGFKRNGYKPEVKRRGKRRISMKALKDRCKAMGIDLLKS